MRPIEPSNHLQNHDRREARYIDGLVGARDCDRAGVLEREIKADGGESSFVARERHLPRRDDLGIRGKDVDGVALPIAPAMFLLEVRFPVEGAKQGGDLLRFRDDHEIDVCRVALDTDVMIKRDRADDYDPPSRLRTTKSGKQFAVCGRDRECHGASSRWGAR